MKRRVLVTGGAGFIGSHVVDTCIEAGHEVAIIDNLSTGRLENVNPKARFYKLDILDSGIEQIFEKERFDCINHHAAQVSISTSVDAPLLDARINILGSLNLLELAKKYKVKKFIFASTGGAIYGEQDYFPTDEGHPLRPISPYGVAKLAVEKYLYYYMRAYSLEYLALRYANVYGPRQDPFGEAGVVAIFSQKMLAGEQPIINGDGKQTRDFVYVGDISYANLLGLELEVSEVLNFGTGTETSILELFEKTKETTGTNSKSVFGPPKMGEQRRSSLNYSRAKKLLDWQPEVDLNSGLKQTVEYFKGKQTVKK